MKYRIKAVAPDIYVIQERTLGIFWSSWGSWQHFYGSVWVRKEFKTWEAAETFMRDIIERTTIRESAIKKHTSQKPRYYNSEGI